MYYIRFTNNIERDIKNGSSKDFRDGSKLNGICAWEIPTLDNPNAPDEDVIKAGKEYAKVIANNTYGGYSSSNEFVILKGTYVGSSNDGCLIEIDEVISKELL